MEHGEPSIQKTLPRPPLGAWQSELRSSEAAWERGNGLSILRERGNQSDETSQATSLWLVGGLLLLEEA